MNCNSIFCIKKMSYFLGFMFQAPKGQALKTKDFLLQEFVNLQKWLFYGGIYSADASP